MTLGELFEEYSRKARLFPGLIAALPILVMAALFLPREPLLTVTGVVVSAGAALLLASFVRSLGKRMEERLIEKWDGLPTTRMLRHRQPQNTVLFARRRRTLEWLLGEPLPTNDQELARPDLADDSYVAATRFLIVHVRERRADFPRVHEENISYGFARNLLGLKPIAVAAVLLAIAGDGVAIYVNGTETVVIAVIGIHLVLVLFWGLFVRASWVLQAGTTYAERLFETLDSPKLQNSASGGRVVQPRRGKEGNSTVPTVSD